MVIFFRDLLLCGFWLFTHPIFFVTEDFSRVGVNPDVDHFRFVIDNLNRARRKHFLNFDRIIAADRLCEFYRW